MNIDNMITEEILDAFTCLEDKEEYLQCRADEIRDEMRELPLEGYQTTGTTSRKKNPLTENKINNQLPF